MSDETEKPFNISEAQGELKALRSRARRLERDLEAALKQQLRELSTKCYQASDASALLADVRRFVDERPER